MSVAGSKQMILKEVLEQVPVQRKKTARALTCGICKHFPLTGRKSHYCREAGGDVQADDTCYIFFKKRRAQRAPGTGRNLLPKDQWKPCEICGHWLKTADSVRHGIGSGCKKKLEKG